MPPRLSFLHLQSPPVDSCEDPFAQYLEESPSVYGDENADPHCRNNNEDVYNGFIDSLSLESSNELDKALLISDTPSMQQVTLEASTSSVSPIGASSGLKLSALLEDVSEELIEKEEQPSVSFEGPAWSPGVGGINSPSNAPVPRSRMSLVNLFNGSPEERVWKNQLPPTAEMELSEIDQNANISADSDRGLVASLFSPSPPPPPRPPVIAGERLSQETVLHTLLHQRSASVPLPLLEKGGLRFAPVPALPPGLAGRRFLSKKNSDTPPPSVGGKPFLLRGAVDKKIPSARIVQPVPRPRVQEISSKTRLNNSMSSKRAPVSLPSTAASSRVPTPSTGAVFAPVRMLTRPQAPRLATAARAEIRRNRTVLLS